MKIYSEATHIVAQCPSLGQPPRPKILPCPNCGSAESRTGAGRKPQEASLHCRECKRFIRWIAANDFYLFTETDKKGSEG
jgi:hypothetical protein